jgi:hypothetical protein
MQQEIYAWRARVVACAVQMQILAWCVLKVITFSTSLVWMISLMNFNIINQAIESARLIASNARIEFALAVLRISTSTKACVFRFVLPKNTQPPLISMMTIVIWKIFVLGKTLCAPSTTTLCKMAAAASVHSHSLLHLSGWGGRMNQPSSVL